MAQAKAKSEKVQCETCGKSYVPAYINTHKRNQHGIYQRGPKALTSLNGSSYTHVEGFILLEDSDGNLWLAEKIK